MIKAPFDEKFWTERYREGTTGWNIGYPSAPIVEYIDQLKDRSIRVLIPGAGNAYEAEYMHQKGFRHVHVLDISRLPLENLARRFPDFPAEHLIHADFFQHKGKYDLILTEGVFFASDKIDLTDQVVERLKN